MIQEARFAEIDALIDEWLLAPDPEIEAVVRQHRVLPITADMGGNYFFRAADRQVLSLGWGPNDRLHIEEPSLCMCALVAGAKKYPQILPYLPQRPSDAADCIECQGTGMILQKIGCGACWSLGWLHVSVNLDQPVPPPPRPLSLSLSPRSPRSLASFVKKWLSRNR